MNTVSKLAFLVVACAGALGYQPAVAQVDATGESVVKNTLRKSEKGDLASGGSSSIAEFLAKNAGKEYRMFQMRNKWGVVYAEIRFNFEPHRVLIRPYYSSGNGNGPLLPNPYYACEVSAMESSTTCSVSTGSIGAMMTAGNFSLAPYGFEFTGGLYAPPSCDYCTGIHDIKNYYITQDRLNADLGFASK